MKRSRCLLLVGLSAVLGYEGFRSGPASPGQIGSVIANGSAESEHAPDTSAPAVTPADAPKPVAPELPVWIVLVSRASPDGKSWCVLDVALEAKVPARTLRALWTAIEKEQPMRWKRLTCRFYLPEQYPDDPWADVNEITILESPPPRRAVAPFAPDAPPEDLEIFFEDGNCIVCAGGFEIATPEDRVEWRWGAGGPFAGIRYWDSRREELRTAWVAVPAEHAPPAPPPECWGLYFR